MALNILLLEYNSMSFSAHTGKGIQMMHLILDIPKEQHFVLRHLDKKYAVIMAQGVIRRSVTMGKSILSS